jgi:dihydroorotate dehydrogenase (fumarate)/dihydroorotate dehydrogenase (NAD+) catalytic subunit
VLGGVCGYSGAGIKPLVLAAIYELRQRGFDLPIMGCGGVQSGRDVREYQLAGAQTAQVYSALHQDMFGTLERITDEYFDLDLGPTRRVAE